MSIGIGSSLNEESNECTCACHSSLLQAELEAYVRCVRNTERAYQAAIFHEPKPGYKLTDELQAANTSESLALGILRAAILNAIRPRLEA